MKGVSRKLMSMLDERRSKNHQGDREGPHIHSTPALTMTTGEAPPQARSL